MLVRADDREAAAQLAAATHLADTITMAVNLEPPRAENLLSISGVRLGIAKAGIRKPNRKDLLLVAVDEGSRVAGVFTRNRFAAAPVLVCREHLAGKLPMRGIVVNTGVANAGTGEEGLLKARATCAAAAQLLGVEPSQILPLSTGVIMEPLPVDRIEAGLPLCHADLAATHWPAAAEAIMTTDTVPKAVSRQTIIDGKTITVTGISKGAGMIEPNMATMLGLIATDAAIGEEALRYLARVVADHSFNAITVDGDTSTNDTLLLIATCRAGNPEIVGEGTAEFGKLCEAVTEVAQWLAQAIVRDGEGATKFITITVDEAGTPDEAMRVAKSIANSPLVKTAFFASDPNLGRILAAVGNAGIADLDASKVGLQLGNVVVVEHGARAASYTEQQGKAVMEPAEIAMRVTLGRGVEIATAWTCDFSYDYVKINADYRS
jgi:glutamate N-acetyltransferase/amino-acid N-acetyltransferase